MQFYYLCKSELNFIGLDKAIATLATRIHDLSIVDQIKEKSFIYYFLRDYDDIAQIINSLQGNVLINYGLIYDENCYKVNIRSINQREHLRLLEHSRIVITTTFKAKGIIESVSRKFVHEIPPALALNKQSKHRPVFSDELLVIASTDQSTRELMLLCGKNNLKFCVVTISEQMTPNEECILLEHLTRYKFVISLTRTNSTWAIFAATLECIVIGAATNDYLRRCYPYTITQTENLTAYFNILLGLLKDINRLNFLSNFASKKSVSFNPANISYDISAIHCDSSIVSTPLTNDTALNTYESFAQQITLIFGKKQIALAKNKFVVACAVKNGENYVTEWMQHYTQLGAAHFFIVDNGSTDGTILSFKNYPNVTILVTTLDFKYYESEIRKFVVKNYCRKMWCLSVDIDEFFDFPMSDSITMENFLDYQNSKGYTTVIAHMLDMFCYRENVAESFRTNHQFYDNSKLCKSYYHNLGSIYNRYNKLSDQNLKFFYGGVRSKFFGGMPNEILLMKHSLTYQDGTLEPHTDPHYCDKAYVSDISCVLFHYKFTDFSIVTIKERAKNKVYNYFADVAYQAYLTSLERKPDISLHSEHAKKYTNISSLLQEQFVTVTPAYIKMVQSLNR